MPRPPSRRKGKARAADSDDDSDASAEMTPASEQYDEGSDDSDGYGPSSSAKRKAKRPARKSSTRNRLIQLAAGYGDDSDSAFRASSRGAKALNYNEDAMGTDFEDSDEDDGSGVAEIDAAQIECAWAGLMADRADNDSRGRQHRWRVRLAPQSVAP